MLKLSHIWPVGAPISWCLFLTCPHHSLSTSLLTGTRYFRLAHTFPALSLESAISPRTLVPLSGERYSEAKIWILGCIITPSPLKEQMESTCVHTHTHIHPTNDDTWTDLHIYLLISHLYILNTTSSHLSNPTNIILIFVIPSSKVKNLAPFILNIFIHTHLNDPQYATNFHLLLLLPT